MSSELTDVDGSDDDKASGLATHKWVFPMSAETVCSTSEDESHQSDSPNSYTSHDLSKSTKPCFLSCVQQSEALNMNALNDEEWSLRVGPSFLPKNHTHLRPGRPIKVSADIHDNQLPQKQASGPVRILTSQLSLEKNPSAAHPNRDFLQSSPASHSSKPLANFVSSHFEKKGQIPEAGFDSDEDTDRLLVKSYQIDGSVNIPELREEARQQLKRRQFGREGTIRHPDYPDSPIGGLLFPACYLGSTQLCCIGHPTKAGRLRQAQEAVDRIKAPDGETQPSVPVELFISVEKILVLSSSLEEIMMDHNLRLISFIADIGEILVLMARRNPSSMKNRKSPSTSSDTDLPINTSSDPQIDQASYDPSLEDAISHADVNRPAKIVCHVFESDEAQAIATSIGRAFQESFFEFLRQHGVKDLTPFHANDYQDVLNQQEIYRNEIEFFSNKDKEKEVIIPKHRGEALGVVIVESGWGSALPTVVLANMLASGPAARCGQLNIGNQLISINGQSLVGLPLPKCQSLIKVTKHQTAVKLVVVDCSPVVEVMIRRPDLKYQLGFSVQDGVICTILRGGIAERGGIRVDHRIIEINGESVVAVSHERIVQMLASAVGEVHIRTMPTSIFYLLTGQKSPRYI